MEPSPGEMHVIGAGFGRADEALAAEAELRSMLDLEGTDIVVHEVGGSEEFVNGFHVVLAGRIREGVLGMVRGVFHRHGGAVLTDVPETWTWGPPGPVR
jgi:hypothetical protein